MSQDSTSVETERARRECSIDHAAVAAFARLVAAERRPDALARATLTFASKTLCGWADLSQLSADGTSLEIIDRLGGDAAAVAIPIEQAGIHAEAVRQSGTVVRALIESDYARRPDLREMAYGAAAVDDSGESRLVLAVFSRDRPFDGDAAYLLEAIAAMYAGAVARFAAQAQLADGQRRVQLLLDQVPALITTFDRDLVFTSVQGSVLRGLPELHPEGWVGKALFEIGVTDDSPPVKSLRNALRGVPCRNEFEYLGRTFENRAEPLRDHEGRITGVLNMAFDVTESRVVTSELADSREQLRRLTAAIHEVQEQERRHIARDVHDELGQRMTALRLDLGLLRAEIAVGNADAALVRVGTMLELVDETITTVREIASGLRPPLLDDFGLRAALEHQLTAFSQRTGIAFTLSYAPEDLSVRSELATALHRIVQEALTNVARHSSAKQVGIRVESCNGRVGVEISDDGRGITAEQLDDRTTLGLSGMRERAYAVGGIVIVEGRPEGGTRVFISIPE